MEFHKASLPAIADGLRSGQIDLFDYLAETLRRVEATDAELRALLEQEPLPGSFPISGGPGHLHRNVDLLGAAQPCWVIRDSSSFSLERISPSIR
mgnify:CR=1 FL=1